MRAPSTETTPGAPSSDRRDPGLRPAPDGFRGRVYTIIFGTDTPGGRLFDILLIWAILVSVAAVMLESVPAVRAVAIGPLYAVEWIFTILFTLEYALRVYSSRHRVRYVRSFFGIIDLLSVLPTWLALFFPVLHVFGVVRVFRLLRLFRIFKLLRYMRQATVLGESLRNAMPKIIVFQTTLAGIVITLGSLMYLLEGPEAGFTSIPKSIYWAVITVTTVGYGDLVPVTVAGQALATFAMILGYSVIAVPTGIISAEWVSAVRNLEAVRACAACGKQGHATDAAHCNGCGCALGAAP